jgi:N,N'-diacetyllegionaminate synthase
MAIVTQNLSIRIGDRMIGPQESVFVIAEAGVNHNGDLDLARQLIDAAVQAGADAIKFQTFSAETLVTAAAPKADYQRQTTNEEESQLEMLRRLELPRPVHRELQLYCHQRGIMFLSTPFDESAVDFLDQLGVPAFKISSGDITNIPLLEHIARKGKPILLSTGMSDMNEVRKAVQMVRDAGHEELVLLQCVSNYPADPADVNLRAMQTMATEFGVRVGYSDHTAGIEVALAAVALGACVIEKHFTLDRSLAGPDHQASLEPNEFAAMIEGIRKVEAALGDGRKARAESEADTMRVARRSLTAARDIPAGTILTRDLIAIQRPGSGLSPALLPSLVGRRVCVDVSAGSLISFEMLE